MGTDAHVFIEYSPAWQGDGSWDTVGGEWGVCRNYLFFAHLAGVRNYHDDVTPIAPNRGWPDGTWAKDDGYHSLTWVTLQEWCQAMRLGAAQDDMEARLIASVAGQLEQEYGKNVRLLIGFDS